MANDQGFRPIGKIAAQLVAQRSRADVQVGDAWATVLVAEAAAQVIWHRGAPGVLAGQSIWNDFIGPGMGDQLRALAAAVDRAEALIEGDSK